MNKVRVNVSRKMIDFALQQTSTNCAIALALKDSELNGNEDAVMLPHVDQKTIRFTDRVNGVRYTIPTPERIAKFIDDWDHSRALARPFQFTIDLDDPAVIAKPMRHASQEKLIAMAERVRGMRVRNASKGVHRSERPLRG